MYMFDHVGRRRGLKKEDAVTKTENELCTRSITYVGAVAFLLSCTDHTKKKEE